MPQPPHRPIDEIQREQEALLASMAALSAQWLGAASEWIAADWRLAAERAVRSDPARVKELAAGGDLPRVKSALEMLVAEAPALVTERFAHDPQIWAHIEGRVYMVAGVPGIPNERSYMYAGEAMPEAFDFGMRRLKGRVFLLLRDYRLGRPLDRGQWQEDEHGLRYPFNIRGSAAMQEHLERYSEAYQRLVVIALELTAAEVALEVAEAQALWDNA